MRHWIMICLLLGNLTYAGPIQTWHLTLAQRYVQQKHYAQALAHYEKIEPKNDTIHYNMANLFYHEKHYQEAISHYTQITSSSLMHQKFHNIANCLMQLGETASALKFYHNALKFGQHPDTIFNLKLAESILKQEEKEEKEKIRRESNEILAFREGNNKINRFKEDNGTDDLKDAKAPKEIIRKYNSTGTVQSREGGKIDFIPFKEENTSIKQQDPNLHENYVAQRWEQYFQKRSLKTLLIPLQTQGASHDQNPY